MKTKHLGGFTLLEMMVVLTIVSMLSLAGWGGWRQQQQRRQLDDSAQQIQRLLQRLRSDANWRNVDHLLWLQPGAPWCLGTGPKDSLCAKPHRLQAPYPGVSVRTLTRGTGFYGKKNAAHPGHIVIASAAGERRIIVSSRGRIRICPQSEENCR